MDAINFLDRSLTVDSRYGRYADQTVLAAALATFQGSGRLLAMLRTIISDEQLLREIAARSYVHPNGFLKIVLLSRELYQLRLHVWPGDARQGAVDRGNIHNHRWDFAATVLRGGYRHQEFVTASDGDSHGSYEYDADRGAGRYSLAYRGTVGLRCVFNSYLPAGTFYSLSADVIHKVSCPPGKPTVSLILQGSYRKSMVDVFSSSPVPTGQAIPLVALRVPEVRRELMEMVNGIDRELPAPLVDAMAYWT